MFTELTGKDKYHPYFFFFKATSHLKPFTGEDLRKEAKGLEDRSRRPKKKRRWMITPVVVN